MSVVEVPQEWNENGATDLSNAKIDKLGKRMRSGDIDEAALIELELFRSLFFPAYAYVESILMRTLKFEITGRPSKSTVAIVDKLGRESIRLSQMQDIAGCRILTTNIASQEAICQKVTLMLGDVAVDDKRNAPTNGYRAVHLVYKHNGRPVEIQVRTRLQHVWSEISEKISDVYGHSIKYGRGEPWALAFLSDLSNATSDLESVQYEKICLSQMRSRSGRNKAMILENKRLNGHERQCIKRIKLIFDSLKLR